MKKNLSRKIVSEMDYDPSWLVKLAKEQYPHLEWFADALSVCTHVFVESPAYYYCIPRDVSFDFDFTIILYGDETQGEVVVDVMKNQTIGGLEFILALTDNWSFLRQCEKNSITVD